MTDAPPPLAPHRPPRRPTGEAADAALTILAVGAGLAFLWVARSLLVPVVIGVVLALTVHPLVIALERRRIPRSVASIAGTLVATAVLAGIGALLYDRMSSLADELPGYESRIHDIAGDVRRNLLHLQRRSEQIVQPPARPGAVQVQESVPWTDLLVGTAAQAVALVAEASVVVFVLYFALAEGPLYRQKLLRRARTPSQRVRVRAMLNELHRDVEQYMLNRVVLNAILGAVTWLAYALYGLKHAAIWGITTALLHLVPYVGPAIGLLLPTSMALLQYGSWRDVLLVGGIYLALVSVQGNVVDPIFLGKQLRLSATAVFLGSLFWFWLWGPFGLFLAVPLLSTIRIVCRRVPRFRMLAELLAE